jgi:hypothetical protein
MKPSRSHRYRPFLLFVRLAAVGAVALLAGCNSSLFVPKHKVLVDAISAPGMVKPTGKSYRLVAKRSMVTQASVPVVKACVDAALTSVGMFEPPANAAPDLFIEVSFGRESAPRADAASRETYLQMSARSNPDLSTERATGPEVWDVKAAVLGVSGSIETAMPLLASVAANYLASDTRLEAKVEVAQNDAGVEAIRNAAIKLLEGKNPAPVTAPPPQSSAGSSGATVPEPAAPPTAANGTPGS